jgi:hypothetical protein
MLEATEPEVPLEGMWCHGKLLALRSPRTPFLANSETASNPPESYRSINHSEGPRVTSWLNNKNAWFFYPHPPVQNERMVDSSAQNGSHLPAFLILAAIISIIAYAIARRIYVFFKIRNTPLTRADTFHEHDSQSQPTDTVRPRLTSVGHLAVIIAVLMGTLLVGLTYAILHMFAVHDRLAKAGQTITANVLSTSKLHGYLVQYEFRVEGKTYQGDSNLPTLDALANARKSKGLEVLYLPSDPTINRAAEEKTLPYLIGLLPLSFLALIVVIPLGQLRGDYLLATTGRRTTGIVVGILPGTKLSSSVYYDFLNDRSDVTRGKSWLPVPYSLKVLSGSSVQVLYLPNHPERNALKQSICWRS